MSTTIITRRQSAEAVEAELRAHGALRTKGFVQLDTGLALVQGVGRRIELVKPPGEVDHGLVGRVVVIHRVDADSDEEEQSG
jgi:hypothetical protein